MKKALFILTALLLLQGCNTLDEKLPSFSMPDLSLPEISMPSIPGIYRADIHQGNIVDQEMVNQLKPGMNKRQVRFIMGSPLLIDTFHQERWVYFSSKKVNGDLKDKQRLSLFFEAEKLARIEGDLIPLQSEQETTETPASEPTTTK
jgi:outer membrane protein assembly factor BamE